MPQVFSTIPFILETARLLAIFIRRRAIPMILAILELKVHAYIETTAIFCFR